MPLVPFFCRLCLMKFKCSGLVQRSVPGFNWKELPGFHFNATVAWKLTTLRAACRVTNWLCYSLFQVLCCFYALQRCLNALAEWLKSCGIRKALFCLQYSWEMKCYEPKAPNCWEMLCLLLILFRHLLIYCSSKIILHKQPVQPKRLFF